MKKSLRLIITKECNLSCEYCCNNIPKVKSKFIEKTLDEIDFSQYGDVCITGGEPTLKPELIEQIAERCVANKMYLYTNGLVPVNPFIFWLFNCINIGIHSKEHFDKVLNINFSMIACADKIQYYVEDIYMNEYIPDWIDRADIHCWTRNNCFNNTETEDWIILKET